MQAATLKTEKDRQFYKTSLPAVLAAIILAFILEGIFAAYSAIHGAGNAERLAVSAVDTTDVTLTEEGWLSDSPKTMFFLEDGGDWGRLELTFASPTPVDMTVELYYADSSSPEKCEFDQFRRTEGYLLAGTTKGVVNLPAGNWDRYRLDIDGAYCLQSIKAARKVPLSSLTPAAVLSQVSWLWLLVFLFFGIAGALLFSPAGFGHSASPASKKPDRTLYLDAVRVLAMIFVVFVHVEEHWKLLFPAGSFPYVLVEAFCIATLSCNLMFVMISGALLLPWREESLGTFFKKRVLVVLLPFLVYSLFYIRGMCLTETSPGSWILATLRIWIGGNIIKGAHLWLIYVIFGLYVVAVPLRYMLRSMPEKMEKVLACLILLFLGFQTVSAYTGRPVGISTFFGDWPGIFLMGYFLTRGWMRRYDGLLVGGGILSFIISVYLAAVRPDFTDIVMNCSLLMLLITSAFIVVLLRADKRLKPLGPALACCSRYSYSVLLIHYFVLYTVIYHGIFNSFMPRLVQIVLPFFLCLFLSFLFAALIDRLVVNVLTALLDRKT